MRTRKPRLLDLFSCAGGAGMGYHRAGFEVTGVDIQPQPRYPFTFVQADALEYLATHWHEFDAIHASPPCQAHTAAQVLHGREHPDLLPQTRAMLTAQPRPWVMENVSGAPMPGALVLCGTEFGLNVRCQDGVVRELRRHRLFESSVFLMGAGGCHHTRPAISVFGHGGPRLTPRPGAAYEGQVTERRAVLGIDWMNRDEMSQSIPPSFTEFIGEQLLRSMAMEVAA